MGGSAGVDEMVRVTGPGVDLDEQAGQGDVREAFDGGVPQDRSLSRQVFSRERRDHEMSGVVEAGRPAVAAGEDRFEGFDSGVQLAAELVEAGTALEGHADELAQLGSKRRPAVGRDEITGRVGVAAGPADPHVPGSQRRL